MGSPEKPIDVEMGDMSDETKELNPEVKVELLKKEEPEKDRFTGLKKEELLAISNEPKWVRARWVLFILFWLVWIAMLVGAILIVVNAPRCKPEPVPQWYQDTVVYEADVAEFAADFKGMENHLPYIQSLKSDAVLVSGAGDPTGNLPGFDDLKKAMEDKSMKLMVDLVIDTLSISHTYFQTSAVSGCTGNLCDFFIWRPNSTDLNQEDSKFQWVYNEARGSNYKASKSDANLAFINYGNAKASEYAMDLVGSWFNKGIDGVQLRDLANVQESDILTNKIWKKYIEDSNATVPRALFLYSSAQPATQMLSDLSVNGTNTIPSPVQVNAGPAMEVNKANSGKLIQNSITAWRSQSRSISAYTVSPLGGPLAEEKYGNKTASGLNLLVLTLPGVPVLRSGDEIGAQSSVFEWPETITEESIPENTNQNTLLTTKGVTVLRVAGIQCLQALRYDTQDADTTFNFLDIGNDAVVAFLRKWTTKAAVLVVSNMSPTEQTVAVNVAGGLLDKDDNLVKKTKVVVASSDYSADAEVDLSALKLSPGTTVIFKS
nr:4F2 cell-surface antigen heavy chain [Ciona intestinalis]|eukprot:XP_002120584.1 4F2 cell-surface antigen heavy chain [Ciona intestinalis]